uniref:Uncharacterized protein n=1 Tax=Pseudictyota dubia TaxID=2749911 RepID=A0A7R9W4A8_9STRA
MKNVTSIIVVIFACIAAVASGHEELGEWLTSDHEGRELYGGKYMKGGSNSNSNSYGGKFMKGYDKKDWGALYNRCCKPKKGIDTSCDCPIKNGDWKKFLPEKIYEHQMKKWATACKGTIRDKKYGK